ncbi:MAG: nuclear transport factor 2 family protein [Gemmatimonadales bacterium]
MPRRLILLASLALGAACAPKAETPEQATARLASESVAAKIVIDSLNAEFDAAFNAGDGAAVAAQYAENGSLAVANSPVMAGRDAIAQGVNGLATMKAAIRTKAVSVSASGPLAVEAGEYTLSVVPPGAPGAVSETGTYLIHWHLIDGHWLRVADLATSPAPLPAPN